MPLSGVPRYNREGHFAYTVPLHLGRKGQWDDTLSNHTVIDDALPKDQLKGLSQINVPVTLILIGRLVVDLSTQVQGIGEFLLIDALRRTEYLATKIGIRAVEVDAINDPARKFYEKYRFFSWKDDPHHLFLPMKVIRKLKLVRLWWKSGPPSNFSTASRDNYSRGDEDHNSLLSHLLWIQ